MTDQERAFGMQLLRDLTEAHVRLGRLAKQLLAAIDAGATNEDELMKDLEQVAIRMEAIDAEIRKTESKLGVQLAPGSRQVN